MKDKKNKNTTKKKSWSSPKLEILSEKSYERENPIVIHAQYGGGGTGTHIPTGAGRGQGSLIEECR